MIPYKKDFVTLNRAVINYLLRCSYHLLYINGDSFCKFYSTQRNMFLSPFFRQRQGDGLPTQYLCHRPYELAFNHAWYVYFPANYPFTFFVHLALNQGQAARVNGKKQCFRPEAKSSCQKNFLFQCKQSLNHFFTQPPIYD